MTTKWIDSMLGKSWILVLMLALAVATLSIVISIAISTSTLRKAAPIHVKAELSPRVTRLEAQVAEIRASLTTEPAEVAAKVDAGFGRIEPKIDELLRRSEDKKARDE